MKLYKDTKGSALLWVVLLGIVSSILLAAILTASEVFYKYTLYTTKRQQAYFTARSAVNIILEEFSSDEQEYDETKSTQKTAVVNGQTMKINEDGNYIVTTAYTKKYNGNCSAIFRSNGEEHKKGDTITIPAGSIVDYNGNVVDVYYGGNWYPLTNDIITSDGYLRSVKTEKSGGTLIFNIGGDYGVTGYSNGASYMNVRKAAQGISVYTISDDIQLLPDKEETVVVKDFAFDATLNMGQASATIYRDENDEVTINVTAYYPDAEHGEEYKIKATVERQPVYFGGIAIKSLQLNGNLTLGENTDLYWNNEETFDTKGRQLSINGNLVTLGNATVRKNSVVAGREFYGDASFTKETGARKIWSASEYIISNKKLTVGESSSNEYSSTTLNTLKRLSNNSTEYILANNYDERYFGAQEGGLFDDLLTFVAGKGFSADVSDENLALRSSSSDSTAIKYIKVISLPVFIKENVTGDMGIGGEIVETLFDSTLAYDARTGNFIKRGDKQYKIMDVSYIDYSSTDEMNRSDEITPVFYMFLMGEDAENSVKLRIKYGNIPTRRSNFFTFGQSVKDQLEGVIQNAFNINESPSYGVIYMEPGSTLELGYGASGSNPEDLVFMYSIYAQPGATVILHDGVTLVGEIVCDNLKIEGDVNIVYSSTSGSQVAKQKIAEYWTISGYKEG